MRALLPIAGVLALAAAVVVGGLATHGRGSGEAIVRHVRDGDTIELENGDVIRLVQIDTPELSEDECYAREARRALKSLLPVGTHVRVVEDARLDHVDRYGRKLGYVFKGTENLNRVLVSRGAAGVWFFDGRRGRYASRLLAAERRARARSRGLWGACPGTRLDPNEAVDSGLG